LSGWERRQRRKTFVSHFNSESAPEVNKVLDDMDLTTPPRTPDPEDEEEDDQSWGKWTGISEEWNEEVEQQKNAKERARHVEHYERCIKKGDPSYEALEEKANNAKARLLQSSFGKARLLQSKHNWQAAKNLGACVAKASVPCPKPPPKARPCPKPTCKAPTTVYQRLTGIKPPPPCPPDSVLLNKTHLHPPPPAAGETKAGMSIDEAFECCMDQFHAQADKGPDAHRDDEYLEEELKRMKCEKLTHSLSAAERHLREAVSEVFSAGTCKLRTSAKHNLTEKKLIYRQVHVRCGTWGLRQNGYETTQLLRTKLQAAALVYMEGIVEDEEGSDMD